MRNKPPGGGHHHAHRNPDRSNPAPTQFQCRHIHTDGRRCGSVCLRHQHFCYFHHTARRPIANPAERRGRRATFTLPLIEDRASIQAAIAHILARIASNDLDPRRAGLLLYGLQIASTNLPRQAPQASAQAAAEAAAHAQTPQIEELIEDPALGPLAPATEYAHRHRAPRKPTLEEILTRQWEQDKAEEAARQQAEAAARTAAGLPPIPPQPQWNPDPDPLDDTPQHPGTLPTLQATATAKNLPRFRAGLQGCRHLPPTAPPRLPLRALGRRLCITPSF